MEESRYVNSLAKASDMAHIDSVLEALYLDNLDPFR